MFISTIEDYSDNYKILQIDFKENYPYDRNNIIPLIRFYYKNLRKINDTNLNIKYMDTRDKIFLTTYKTDYPLFYDGLCYTYNHDITYYTDNVFHKLDYNDSKNFYYKEINNDTYKEVMKYLKMLKDNTLNLNNELLNISKGIHKYNTLI